MSWKGDMQCSFQQWIQCTSFIIETRIGVISEWRSQTHNLVVHDRTPRTQFNEETFPRWKPTKMERERGKEARNFGVSDGGGLGEARENPSIIVTCTAARACKCDVEMNTIACAKRQSRSWFTSSRITRTKKYCKKICKNIAIFLILVAKIQRNWFTAWETWSEYFETCEITPNMQCIVWQGYEVRIPCSDRYDVLTAVTRKENLPSSRRVDGVHFNVGQILERFRLNLTTIIMKHRCCNNWPNRSRGPFLHRHGGRATTTRKYLGSCVGQFRN